jgi:hypothetical protein
MSATPSVSTIIASTTQFSDNPSARSFLTSGLFQS